MVSIREAECTPQYLRVRRRNAHRTLDDGRLCFLYSVKLDADVLVLEPDAAAEMEEQATALEVADSVLDVRHAFLQVGTPRI